MSNKNGVKVKYYLIGNKSNEYKHKNGKPDGVWTTWYKDGTKNSEEHYKDGMLDGVSIFWNDKTQQYQTY